MMRSIRRRWFDAKLSNISPLKASQCIESLEARCLLSASAGPSMIALPSTTAFPAAAIGPGNTSPVGFTPAQIKAAYGISSVKFGTVTGDGTGQTIAIINAFDNPKFVDSTNANFANSDLHRFDVQFGLPDPPSFVKVDENGGTSYPGTDPGWANEAALDVEWTHAIAPKANILLVEANSAGLNDLIDSAVVYARQQPKVSVITMSFAASEAGGEGFYDSFLQTPSGHSGITFVAASGDNGSSGGYPAFSPNVVAVGSTTLTLNSGAYGSEVGRSNSGGGISTVESKPVYQTSIGLSATQRMIPDVAFDGDPNTGAAVYDSFNGGTSNPWYKVGGTSFSGPAWSGIISIIDQGRVAKGMTNLDGASQTLPRLYELSGNDFHDITSGNNGFAAGNGFDLVTGRGTPKANTLIPDMVGGGSISGTVYNDANGDGSDDNSEAGLAGWGVFIDFNGNGTRDANDVRVFSASNGKYTFSDLPGGVTYKLRQGTPAGWTLTQPSSFPMSVTVAAGQAISGKNIGNRQPGTATIAGHMFQDNNGNGTQDSGEANLVGWGCFLDTNNDGAFDGSDIRRFADSSGNYSFTGLAMGTYHLVQLTPSGWQRILPTSDPDTITLSSAGQKVTVNFASRPQLATISGTVFNDLNANGVLNSGESGFGGWGVFIDNNDDGVFDTGDVRVFSGSNGQYSFTNLTPGTYHINEGVPGGVQRTTPALSGYVITVAAGQTASGKNFGNHLT